MESHRKILWPRLYLGMLHNFGGRTGIYGKIQSVGENSAIAYSQASNMVGMGLTPEAIETNVILYDLMMEMPWRLAQNKSGVVGGALDVWVQQFATRRYGGANQEAFAAWNILQNTLLDNPTTQSGTTISVIVQRPSLNFPVLAIPPYNVSVVPVILQHLLNAAPAFQNQQTFQHDVASVTRQMITDVFLVFFNNTLNAYNNKDANGLSKWSGLLLQAILDTDTVVGTQYMWLVGKWLNDAHQWAESPEELALIEFNARNQLTLWGDSKSSLHDYASKLWGGLVRDFYYARWNLFTTQLAQALANGTAFNAAAFTAQVQALEYAWCTANNTYTTTPSGDAVTIAQTMLPKYASYL